MFACVYVRNDVQAVNVIKHLTHFPLKQSINFVIREHNLFQKTIFYKKQILYLNYVLVYDIINH